MDARAKGRVADLLARVTEQVIKAEVCADAVTDFPILSDVFAYGYNFTCHIRAWN